MVRKREIIIQKFEEGKELLEWISSRYTYHNMEKWAEYIDNERVKLNGEKTTCTTCLTNKDVIIYYPEPIIEPPINSNYGIIYEDDDLLVINKPCDLPCHPGGIYFEHTLWYLLKKKYNYISLINRLDRETSGVMLIAKNRISAKFYFNKMMERQIDKEYMVLVHGIVDKEIDAKGWLIKDSNSVIRKKRKFILDSNAQQSVAEGNPEIEYSYSQFNPVKTNGDLTLLRCCIFTGRTHQIRATICSLGFPVVGDKIYGLDDSYFFKFINDTLDKKEWLNLKLKNQALHSTKTTVPMINGEQKTFQAPIPDNWPIVL